MAARGCARWASLALRSSHVIQSPVSRGMATAVRRPVLLQRTCRNSARSGITQVPETGRMLEKHRSWVGLSVHRHFSSSSQQRPEDDDHKHHTAAAGSVHKGDSDEREKMVHKPESFWRRMLNVRQWGLTEVGTAATILCAIDCTVLPVVLTALPLAQMIDPATSHHIAHVAHVVALYFVLPIGSLAVGTNFVQHKRWDIAGLGAAGVLTIAAAHAGVLPDAVNTYQGWANAVGCAGLLSSGWLSHRVLHGGDGHDHDHHHHHHKQSKSCCHSKPKSK